MTDETPAWLDCWKSKEEKEQIATGKPAERERWMNRPTFILASVGAAIGLGNVLIFTFGFGVYFGLNGALATFLSQDFGAKKFVQCGRYLNQSKIVCTGFYIMLSPLFVFSE